MRRVDALFLFHCASGLPIWNMETPKKAAYSAGVLREALQDALEHFVLHDPLGVTVPPGNPHCDHFPL